MVRCAYLLIYLTLLLALYLYYYEISAEHKDFCANKIAFRVGKLVVVVLVPVMAITYFGAYRPMKKYEEQINISGSNNSSYQLIKSECFLALRILWLLFGFTTWSLENIELIQDLEYFGLDCEAKEFSIEVILYLNFYLLEVIGAVIAIVTLVGIPMYFSK
jgi:hypothetical protein